MKDNYKEAKLHSGSLYGKSVYKILEDSSKAITDYIHGKSNFSSAEDRTKPLIEYIHENYCSNRDVATGNYDCPYATTVVNTICCTGHECNHRGIYEKPVVNNSSFSTFIPTPYEDIASNLLANSLPDDKFPF